MSETIPVGLGARSYDIVVGAGLLGRCGDWIAPLLDRPFVHVVADATAWAFHGAAFVGGLETAGIGHSLIQVPPGEASKSFARLETVCDGLLAAGLGRRDHVVAFGGGVVGDLAGFAAGVVMRGVRFIQVPTTLLAQVDSSVGGKTGINTGAGKNMVGLFWQPDLVLADTDVLATLEKRDLRSGWAEVMKYGLIDDRTFFDWCTRHHDDVLAQAPDALAEAVATSVRAKARVVSADEREAGARALLNLGHTFAHALEAAAGYDETLIRHGEAVACGMGLAGLYSCHLGLLDPAQGAAIATLLRASGLAADLGDLPAVLVDRLDAEALLTAMAGDKKNDAGRLTLILLNAIGGAFIEKDADKADVMTFLAGQVARARTGAAAAPAEH